MMYILNKRQQFKDSTLQNGILGQSEKNTDLLVVKKGLTALSVLLTHLAHT